MIVKELLQDAILNLNLNARDPRVLARAVSIFNGIMRRYSGNNIMTAYQNSVDFTAMADEVKVGKYNLKDGYRDLGVFRNAESLPSAENFVAGVDEAYVDGKFFTPDGETWTEERNDVCSFMPDILCPDISDVVSLILKNGNAWQKLDAIPFANFYTDTRKNGFSYRPIGENKIELLLKGCAGRQFKLIYTTSMKFEENSVVELPEIYLPLISAALTEDLGNAFPAVDGMIVDKYRMLRERLENDVTSKNADDRRIVREGNGSSFNFNRVDMWM